MIEKRNYPVISVFVDVIYSLSEERHTEEEIIANTTFNVSVYPKIPPHTREKSLDFAHELIKYFTPHLLYHHFQDDVPIFAVYLSMNERGIDINIHGGYYEKFIQTIPALQNTLSELLVLIKADLDVENNSIEDILMELDTMPRLDIKYDPSSDVEEKDSTAEELDWNYTRVIRTPYSEVYALYLNNESAGEIHLHVGKNVNATIITTLNITEKEKAQLMGYVHETMLEALEEEYETKSTIRFYSEAFEDI